jgi:hypothetical protein
MALFLPIKRADGIVISYHRISSIHSEYDSGVVIVRIKSYISKEIRESNPYYFIREQILTNYQVDSYSDQNGEVNNKIPADKDNFIDIQASDDLSRKNIYEILKKGIYQNSSDV